MLVLMQQFPPIPQPPCLAIKPEEAEAIPAMNRAEIMLNALNCIYRQSECIIVE